MNINQFIAFIEEHDATFKGLADYMEEISMDVPRYLGLQISQRSPNWWVLDHVKSLGKQNPDKRYRWEEADDGDYQVHLYEDSGFDLTDDQVKRDACAHNILSVEPASVAVRRFKCIPLEATE